MPASLSHQQRVHRYPYVRGVSRMWDNKRAVLISLDDEPSDDALRAIHATLNAYPPAATGWLPIETLHRIDVDIVLWNPCDGVHLLNVTTGLGALDEIRRGRVFTHWRKLDHPELPEHAQDGFDPERARRG